MPAWDEWRASGARGARTIVAILDRRAARRRRSPTGSNPFHLPQESTLYRKSLPDDLSQGGASFLSSGGGIRTRDLRVMSPGALGTVGARPAFQSGVGSPGCSQFRSVLSPTLSPDDLQDPSTHIFRLPRE